MKKSIITAVALLILFSACKKNQTNTTTCNLDAAGITGSFNLTSFLVKSSSSSPEVDYVLYYNACQKDDIYSFNADGTYVVSEGATSCSPTNASTQSWSLSNTSLTINGEIGRAHV